MKVTFIGHASILIETRGISILSDPWWNAPCFGAQWWNYPRAASKLVEGRSIDYIYVSHGHHDHLHPGTLRRLDKSARILVAAELDLADGLRKSGFEVVELNNGAEHELVEGVKARIMPTYADDSLMVVSDGDEVCLNLNDALHAAPATVQEQFIGKLRSLYPVIDYAFCGYGVASHFPNCYCIPGKDREATAIGRQRYFSAQWAGLVTRLAPRFAFPFAADVVFLQEDLFWVNEPTHNAERPTETLSRLHPGFAGQAFDIAPGFEIDSGRVTQAKLREPINAADLRRDMAEEIESANHFGTPDRDVVDGVCRLIEGNITKCNDYLQGYRGDYQVAIRFPGAAHAVLIEKLGDSLSARTVEDGAAQSPDMTFTTRAQYLRTSLSRKHGHETIFVGSGGLFDYPSRKAVRKNLRPEVSVMIRMHDSPPIRKPQPNQLVFKTKHFIKRLLGRVERDLYDLEAWTVWK
jgi:L-ascorbate metabolism protein UlaG (beta-lactamase superfamily)